MNEQTCRGCGRRAPDDDTDPLSRWAVVDQVRNELYCPNCLTPAEADRLSTVAQQAVEDQLLLNRLPDARQGVFVPEQRNESSHSSASDQPVS